MARSLVSAAGLALLVCGCSRVPADVSTPDPRAAASVDLSASAGGSADAAPIPSACVETELSQCVAACQDSACLAECGGEACVATIASLSTCMDGAEQEFRAANPKPSLELREVIVDGAALQEPTEASLAREDAWFAGLEQARRDRWDGACAGRCAASLDPDPTDPGPDPDAIGFCRAWTDSYRSWASLTKLPQTAATADAGVLSILSSEAGLFAVMQIGSSMRLVEAGPNQDTWLLDRLLAGASATLDRLDAAGCVPDLDSRGRAFVFAVTLADDGQVEAAEPVGGADPDQAGCVAEILREGVRLPVRVARSHRRFEVHVEVRSRAATLDGALDEIDWATELGGDFETEAGALGQTGDGLRGGGSVDAGPGVGGLGGPGGIGDIRDPDPRDARAPGDNPSERAPD